MRQLVSFVAIAALISVAGGCSDDDGDEQVFSFAEDDDLCAWVTEEEVAEFVAAEFEWDGTATEVEPDDEFAACHWELSPTQPRGRTWPTSTHSYPGLLQVGDAELWRDMDGGPMGGRLDSWGVVDYEDGVVDEGSFSGHPDLTQGVVVHQSGFVAHAFAVPPEIEWRAQRAILPTTESAMCRPRPSGYRCS